MRLPGFRAEDSLSGTGGRHGVWRASDDQNCQLADSIVVPSAKALHVSCGGFSTTEGSGVGIACYWWWS